MISNYHCHCYMDVPPKLLLAQMCFSKSSTKSNDELKRPLNFDSIDENLWNDKCDYIDPQTVKNLNPSGLNLVVLQLNIRSILSLQGPSAHNSVELVCSFVGISFVCI